jgi:hypothetical protein
MGLRKETIPLENTLAKCGDSTIFWSRDDGSVN